MIPNGAAPISSTGIVIQTRATDGQSWDYIQAGKVLSQDTAEIDGIDYAAAPHTMIALHANKALTFDLAAIRQALPEYQALRFHAVAGYGGLGAGADADFAVYVDGTLRAERRNINHASGGTRARFAACRRRAFLDAGGHRRRKRHRFRPDLLRRSRRSCQPANPVPADSTPAADVAAQDRAS